MKSPAVSFLSKTVRPLVEEVSFTPWQAFQRALRLPHVLFLDSALRHATLGRYSFVTGDPVAVLRSRRGRIDWLNPPAWLVETQADPFTVLRHALQGFHTETVPGLPPFQGGVAGLFGYDLCHHIERLPRPHGDEFETPDLCVGFYDWVFAYDHPAERGWLISTGFPEIDPALRRERARRRLKWARSILGAESSAAYVAQRSPLADTQTREVPLVPQWPVARLPQLTSNFSKEAFLATIRRAIEYVHAGDCFQVNIAQRLLYPLREHPARLYQRLRERNPATFAGYFDLGKEGGRRGEKEPADFFLHPSSFILCSASPERFLQLTSPRQSDGQVETRPIKGTRPRGRTPVEDQGNVHALQNSPKDRAENVMIVDLLRNDLGRVCQYGSIRVPSLCQVETYQTVHHLVSVVQGKLRADKGAVDLLWAAFPGGSVTGAPKVRAMQIIAELEPTARGPYCGSLAYIGFDGAMDASILIRTFTAGKGWLQFPVGGGIVADSDPQREYDETLHKAEGLIRALIDEPDALARDSSIDPSR